MPGKKCYIIVYLKCNDYCDIYIYVIFSELYDWRGIVPSMVNYDTIENENVAEKEEFKNVIAQLSTMIKKQFQPNQTINSLE